MIWIAVDLDLNMKVYWWFGGAPGQQLPDLCDFNSPKRIGRRETGERPLRSNHSKVPGARFQRLATLDEVLETLFGPLPDEAAPVAADEVEHE